MSEKERLDKVLLAGARFTLTLRRLCYQLIENHQGFDNSVLVGIQPRGACLAERIRQELLNILKLPELHFGLLDVGFFRDDLRRHEQPLALSLNTLTGPIEGKKVVLIDDVIFTGRTVRAALDALQSYGRPAKVELLCLVDRRYKREVPIGVDYLGIAIDSHAPERVKVSLDDPKNCQVLLLQQTALAP